eukprot:jgi/Mesen1/1615/ME000135S00611
MDATMSVALAFRPAKLLLWRCGGVSFPAAVKSQRKCEHVRISSLGLGDSFQLRVQSAQSYRCRQFLSTTRVTYISSIASQADVEEEEVKGAPSLPTLRDTCSSFAPERLLQRAEELGYGQPTRTQQVALPVVYEGLDCIIQAPASLCPPPPARPAHHARVIARLAGLTGYTMMCHVMI